MRKPPDMQPPEAIIPLQRSLIEETREYKLITPLFGGGVTPGEVDLLTPIRGSEIRGHLRFWWRATRAGQFGNDLKKMKGREDEIWGKAHKQETEDKKGDNGKKDNIIKQTVQIEVMTRNEGQTKKAFYMTPNKNGKPMPRPSDVPDYASFPLRPQNEDSNQTGQDFKSVQHDVQFHLKLTYDPTYEADIQAALWAWETFGGIGARTRRGFGALLLLKIGNEKNSNLPSSNQPDHVSKWLKQNIQKFVVSSSTWPPNVPHLEQALSFALACRESKVLHSWDKLIKRYASFRQSRTKENTGRSNWPEAEAVREATNARYGQYPRLNHPAKFPRAAFGLPILFHFKDSERGDPPDTTLQGAEKENERLASPLILRPLMCQDGRAIGLAVVLKGSPIPSLVLKETRQSVQAQLSESDLSMLPLLNNSKLKGETDILQAFLKDLGGQ